MAFKEVKILTDNEKRMVLNGNVKNETCNISTSCDNGITIAIYAYKGMYSSLFINLKN